MSQQPVQTLPDTPTPTTPLVLPDLGLSKGTSIFDAQQNMLATVTAQVAFGNAQAKDAYLNHTWPAYVANMESGETVPPERRVPPAPPMALVVMPPPTIYGFAYLAPGDVPVCPMPALPFYAAGNAAPNKVPNVMVIGNRIGSTKWFQALPGDTWPSGQDTPPTTSADGVSGVFEKYGAPVGNGWYLQVG